MTAKPLTVVYASDANFWEHVYVSIYSLLVNNQDIAFDVRVLSEAPNERFFEACEWLRTIHSSATIEWLPVDLGTLRHAPTSRWISAASYYRLFLSELLPDTVDRLLYLDGDLIVRGSLHSLFDIELDDVVLAAVAEWCPAELQHLVTSPQERLGLGDNAPYFNAGVLYINLDMWRTLDIGRQGVDYVLTNLDNPVKLEFHDQDTLNVVCAGRWMQVGPSFNYHAWSKTGDRHRAVSTTVTAGYTIPAAGPLIAHYNGEFKPWNGNFSHEFAADYWRYRSRTPYRNRSAHVRSRATHMLKATARTIRKLPGGDAAVRTVRMKLLKA
jgi:lipopolysaccharide biosynthesis glycosyltransferase